MQKIVMKIRGAFVDIHLNICPILYNNYVQTKGKDIQKVYYVSMIMALYGMLTALILYYKKFVIDNRTNRFEVNLYYSCVANRMVNGKQYTVTWHVDNIRSSHTDPKVNGNFLGKRYDYSAIIMDFINSGKLKVNLTICLNPSHVS